MKIKFYLRLLVFTLLGFLNTQWASAQNVTIRGNNGSTIAAVKNGGVTDTFFNLGGFATWQHEQLSMVLTASDGTVLTEHGQLDNPANNLFVSADGSLMQIAKGKVSGANVCYVSLSLPKGYRFTGYTIKFTKPRNAQDSEFNTGNNGSEQSTFGETGSDFTTYTTQATINIGGTAQTITRTEMNDGDMSNVLYFKLQNPSGNRALIQLEHAEFFFTSEENYSPVLPVEDISNVSAVDIPFTTSRVDFGTIENRNYNGTWRVSYSSANVKDLPAYFHLYEAESTTTGTDVDGLSGKVVDYKEGSISSEAGYFKLGKAGQEQVYYIETPTYVTVSDNVTKVPVGYRITAATFDYTNNAVAGRTFYISYTYNGTKYYLYYNGNNVRFRSNSRTTWTMDEDGYISCSSGYLYFNNGYAAIQRNKPSESEMFDIDADNGIYQRGWPDYYIRFYPEGVHNWGGTNYDCLISKDNGVNASYEEISSESSSVDNFTLKIYDKEGGSPETITVSGKGSYTLSGLNNDAVKFGVQGIGLVRATLTLQALDPYLDQMTVVCQDETNPQIRLTEGFTASDFSVSGGEFWFYLPEECVGDPVQISFENLKSKYFDETYTGGSAEHTSRINFVKSAHYNAFGTSNNNVYTKTSEAASATPLERLKVDIVGTQPFKFNNAEDVGSSGGVVEEYAFSLENYAAAPNNGEFKDMRFSSVTTDDQVETRYVFTTDETRYNIAPTTATQHRSYAYYKMIVHVSARTYVPKVAFTKIYGQTLYGTGQKDAFYGVEVTAPYTDGSGNEKQGYSSTDKIFEKIEKILKETKVDDFGNEDLPDDHNKILYLDFSKLKGVYQITTDEHGSMEEYSATNAANCVIFLPVGATAPNDNVAYKTEGGTDENPIFRAANDIVLTDKQPFYTPYDIQMDAAKKVVYKRLITKDKYGKVQNASVILPFVITVTDGVHTNLDGSTFSLHTMQGSDALQLIGDKTYAYFPPLSGVSKTEENMPYLVKLEENSSDDGVSFVVSQQGTLIKATKDMTTDYTFTGTASKGVAIPTGGEATAGTYTFTPKGTYAGIEVAKDDNVFYFAKNQFVSSANLSDNYSTAKIAPFRAYYYATKTGAAKLLDFDVIFEEGLGDVSTGIQAVDASKFVDMDAPVYDLQGRMVATSYRKAKSLKSGMYVVNGVKIMVK